jgi:hypothetical protein
MSHSFTTESYVQFIARDGEIVATIDDPIDIPSEGERIIYNGFGVEVEDVTRRLKRPTGGDWQYVITVTLNLDPS